MGEIIKVTFNPSKQTAIDKADLDLKDILANIDAHLASIDAGPSKEDYKDVLRDAGYSDFEVAMYTKEMFGSI